MESRRNGPQLSSRHDDDDDDLLPRTRNGAEKPKLVYTLSGTVSNRCVNVQLKRSEDGRVVCRHWADVFSSFDSFASAKTCYDLNCSIYRSSCRSAPLDSGSFSSLETVVRLILRVPSAAFSCNAGKKT